MKRSKSPEFPQLEDNAYRVRAQVDVLMPGAITHVERNYVSDGSLLKTLGQKDGIKKAELFRTAENVLRLLKRRRVRYGQYQCWNLPLLSRSF